MQAILTAPFMVEMIRTITSVDAHGWHERSGGHISLMLEEKEAAEAYRTSAVKIGLHSYGLRVDESDGDVCLRVDLRESPQAAELHRMLYEWQAAANALQKGGITREAYDQWRYNFPAGDTTRRWVKVPSQTLMDGLAAGLQEHADDDHD